MRPDAASAVAAPRDVPARTTRSAPSVPQRIDHAGQVTREGIGLGLRSAARSSPSEVVGHDGHAQVGHPGRER